MPSLMITSSATVLARYTLWIPLFPLGFICEGVIALRNIPYFEETEKSEEDNFL